MRACKRQFDPRTEGSRWVRKQVILVWIFGPVPFNYIYFGSGKGVLATLPALAFLFFRASNIRVHISDDKRTLLIAKLFGKETVLIADIISYRFSKPHNGGPYRIDIETQISRTKSYGLCISRRNMSDVSQFERDILSHFLPLDLGNGSST